MLKTVLLTALVTVLLTVLGMNFITPEKRVDSKVEHRYAATAPQFRREMGVMLGPAIVGGNQVTALHNGKEIFPAMLQAIREARKTITFETYIYWSGDIGKEMSEALAERAQAGVKVHVLVDWVGSVKMEQTLLKRMQEAGVELHRYRPLHWYNLGRMNNRTHRKLLVVDGTVAFTGGVGIADQWNGQAQDPEHWRDIHFRVVGPVVPQFQAAFNDNWIKTTGEVLHGAEYFAPQQRHGDMDAHLFLSSPAGGSESMHLMVLMAIAAASKSLSLQASYFVPDTMTIKALLAALERGVSVRILLPGKHIDSDTVRIFSRHTWGPLLAAGAEIYEYQPTMMHNKMLIIDDEMVSVGSTNFDERSFRLNDEASMNVYDRDFALKMTEVFEADLKHAERYTHAMWLERPWTARFMEQVIRPIRSQL